MYPIYQLKVLDSEGALRLDQFLQQRTGESRERCQEQIAQGNVECNGKKVTKASYRVKVGEPIAVRFVPLLRAPTLKPVAFPLDVLFEDSSILVLNKPQGMVVHPASGHFGETLVHYLLHHLREDIRFAELASERPGIIHRLDRGTSGVIVVAKNRRCHEIVSSQFKKREVEKTYECIVWGAIAVNGEARTPIGRHPRDRKRMSSQSPTGREAYTRWRSLKTTSTLSYVEVYPKTGRTHQIRVHLSEMGHPILGDALYRGLAEKKRMTGFTVEQEVFIKTIEYPFLHAKSIQLRHPDTHQALRFEAKRPPIFQEALEVLQLC